MIIIIILFKNYHKLNVYTSYIFVAIAFVVIVLRDVVCNKIFCALWKLN